MRNRMENVSTFSFADFREQSCEGGSLPVCAHYILHGGFIEPLEQRGGIFGQLVSGQESLCWNARQGSHIALITINSEGGIIPAALLQKIGDHGLRGFLGHTGAHFADLVLCVISENGQYRRRQDDLQSRTVFGNRKEGPGRNRKPQCEEEQAISAPDVRLAAGEIR